MRYNLGDLTHPQLQLLHLAHPNTQTKGSRGGRVPSVAGMAGACLQKREGSKSQEVWGCQMETTALSSPTNDQGLLRQLDSQSNSQSNRQSVNKRQQEVSTKTRRRSINK